MEYVKSINEMRKDGNQWALLLYRELVPKGYRVNEGVFIVEHNNKKYYATTEMEATTAKELMKQNKEIDISLDQIREWNRLSRARS